MPKQITMNRYKQMYLEQNGPNAGTHETQDELAFLFDVIHPYQYWYDAHVTTASVKRRFRIKYSNDINNYTKPQITDITPEF